MKEKIVEKLKNELDRIQTENERNLEELQENKSSLEEFESSIFVRNESNLQDISKEMKILKQLKEEYEGINLIKNLHSIIQKSVTIDDPDDDKKLDLKRDIEIIKKQIFEILHQDKNEYASSLLLLTLSINNIFTNNKQDIENWLVKMKFPIFEGAAFNTIITDLKTNHGSKIGFFSHYFEILLELISHNNSDELYNKDEILSSFLSKKIIFTILQPFLKAKRDDDVFQDLLDLFDLMIKYMRRSYDNFFNFVYLCLSNSTREGNNEKTKNCSLEIQKFLIRNTIHQINNYLENHFSEIILFSSSRPEQLVKLFKKISDFNKILKKEFHYDVLNFPTISDILIIININTNNFENLSEIIKIQKTFASNYVKNHIKPKNNETIEKNEFNTIDTFELVKMIIKDNLSILLFFTKDPQLFDMVCNNIYSHTNNDLLGLFRTSYNEEFQIFSSKKIISRKRILFVLDLIIKCLLYINTLYGNVTKSIKNPKVIEAFSNATSFFIQETNNIIENYTSIFSKELRSNGFEDMINLFTCDNLTKLNEETIDAVFTKIKKQINGLYSDLEKVKISIESENFFLKSFLQSIFSRIIVECEKSLKKLPKNKNMNLLTDKTNRVIDEMLTRFTINSDTMSALKKQLEEIRKCFLSLNMNKI